ncbi:MAG: glycosyltransferase family 2 protein [Candidatus Hydrogenedentes bacterium]|nr:glycosyltransferase family 2 protein [Candidatus Hydrogenedentota bacterium]
MITPLDNRSTPSVSILMVIKNERANLERSLPLMQRQTFQGAVEFVCVDSGSTDGTVEFLEANGITPHRIAPKDFHHGRTRNYAASLTRHEILVILSGDAIPADDRWLENLVAPFEDPRAGAVYGRQIPPASIRPLRARYLSSEYGETRQVRDLAREQSVHPGLFRFSNANAAVRRALWERFPWNERVLLAEDQGQCRDILYAGYQVIYEPAAAVIHGHDRSLWGDFQFAVDNGLSLSRLGILNNPEIGGEMGYGIRRMRADLDHYLAQRHFGLAAQSLISSAAKFMGVQVGKREKQLPKWFLRRVSEVHAKLEGDAFK